MSDFKVEIKGLDKLQNALKNYPKISQPILQQAMDASAAIFAKYTTKSIIPWRTGNLLQSFRHTTGKLQARWGPTVNYAAYVQFGTKPHVIQAKRAKVLATRASKATGWPIVSSSGYAIFGTRVNHPGTKAQDFMGRILEKSTPDINNLFGRALDAINLRIADSTK